MLFASHELDRAEGLATRVVTLAGGLVREDSGPVAAAPPSVPAPAPAVVDAG